MDAFALTIPTRIDELWNFSAAADTETKFRALLDDALALSDAADGDHAVVAGRRYPQVLELLTQIARTQGLQRKFDEAHETLDRVQRALTPDAGESLDRQALVPLATRANVRYLLERGRVFNSSKQPELALPLFVQAWEMAKQCDEEDLEVDAAHMVAIAEPSTEKQAHWNLVAIARSESSSDPKARKWIGSLTNNLGWTYHGADRFEDALTMFEKALQFREQAGELKSIIIAKWCKARCLRSLGRIDEALAIQQALAVENEKLSDPDGYNSEELGELLLLKGEPEQARPHFQRAIELLSKDAWFVDNEAARLKRLQELATGTTP